MTAVLLAVKIFPTAVKVVNSTQNVMGRRMHAYFGIIRINIYICLYVTLIIFVRCLHAVAGSGDVELCKIHFTFEHI